MLCDLRFAAEEQTFLAQTELNVGLIPGGGALQLLPSLIGRARALELVLAGQNIDAGLAERYGVINRALPDSELDSFVETLAAQIANANPHVLATAKSAIDRRHLPTEQDLATDQADFVALLQTPKVQQTIAAALVAGLQTRSPLEYNLGNWA